MLTFIRCFALLIGDLVCDCDEWSLFLHLREIVFITCELDSYQNGIPEHLHEIIREHNLLYLKLSKTTLKPKFHNMHYSNNLKKVGPLISNSSNNKINILKTIFIKYQIKLVDFFLNYNDKFNSKIEEDPSKLLSMNILEKYRIDSQLSLQYISYLQYEHLFFKPGMVVHIFESHFNSFRVEYEEIYFTIDIKSLELDIFVLIRRIINI